MSERTRRGITLSWLLLFVLSILLQYGTLAGPKPALAANSANNANIGGFEIDGDFPANSMTPNGADWSNAGNDGAGLVNGPTVQDPLGNGDATVLSNGVSDGDSVATWQMNGSAGAPQKSDMGNVYAVNRRFPAGTGDFYSYVGIERKASTGTVQYDLEFNQLNNLTNANGVSVPNRSTGDLLFTGTQQGGGSWIIQGTVQKWTGAWNTGSWSAPTAVPTSLFYGLANEFAAVHPSGWADDLGSTVPINQFAEMAIDVTAAAPAANFGCHSFGALNLRSISSTGQTPELKDVVAPIPVDLSNCANPKLTTVLTGGQSSNGTSALTLDLGTSSSVTFTDTAVFSGQNASHQPTGTVTYSVYANSTCTGTPMATDSQPIDVSGNVHVSKSFTLNAVGTYYVVASYAGDNYNTAASSGCADEVVTVVKPALSITKTADATPVNAGDPIGFTVTVSNSNVAGTGTAKGVTVNDPLPAGVTWAISPASTGWS
ncbi:MAG: DUF11 domain-containing protein, partial [Chloroflexi bacterium]|nr:DUF11 domain-containing protein [Chloroflexota bacterium]